MKHVCTALVCSCCLYYDVYILSNEIIRELCRFIQVMSKIQGTSKLGQRYIFPRLVTLFLLRFGGASTDDDERVGSREAGPLARSRTWPSVLSSLYRRLKGARRA